MSGQIAMHLLLLIVFGTFIGTGIWTACNFLSKRIVRAHKKWKKNKIQKAKAAERRLEYQARQQMIRDIIARLWEDERFASMMRKYQSLGPGSAYEQNVLRKVRKVLSAKIKTKVRSMLNLEEQLLYTEISARLKL
jgi:hypothetical protein